jgi:hypothetical protein
MERKVYELSGNLTQANKDQAVEVTLGSDVDQIAGPATMNVVRVRCPSQFVGVGTGTVKSTYTASPAQDATPVDAYTSPAEAIANYELAFQKAALAGNSASITQITANTATVIDKYTLFTLGAAAATTTFTLPGASAPVFTVDTSGATTLSPVPNPLHTLIPIFPPGTTIKSTRALNGKEYDFRHFPTLTLEGGVLKLYTDCPFELDSVATERLNLGPMKADASQLVRVGTKEPSFNDVRRIVMTLTPDTQKVIAKDASDPQGTLYDNASISFTVDDDPTDNSAYAAYSLAGDFDTNSLRLKNGATDSISFHLQRCVYDRATGKLGRPEALDLPYANNFVEVKLVADKKKRRFL